MKNYFTDLGKCCEKMKQKYHKNFDTNMKIIITAYGNDFLKYIRETRKKINTLIKNEITLIHGRTIHLDYLCLSTDNVLLNVEFQFTGPSLEDLNRFF